MISKKFAIRYGDAALTIAALSTITGCRADSTASTEHKNRGEDFIAVGDHRAYNQAMLAQAASGARADATLYAYHFDAGNLNSLGQQKLSLMLQDDDAKTPMV